MSERATKRIYAVPSLSFVAAMKIVLLQLHFMDSADLIYFERSHRHDVLASLLMSVFKIRRTETIALRMGDFVSETGSNMWFEKDRIAGRIADKVLDAETMADAALSARHRLDAEYLRMDLKRRVNREISSALNFCCAVNAIADERTDYSFVALVLRSLFTRWIRSEFTRLTLEECGRSGLFRLHLRELGGLARQLLFSLRRVSVKSRAPLARGAQIAVQFSPGARLTPFDSFPWLQAGIVDPTRVLVYDDALKPIPDDIKTAIEKLGAEVVRFDAFVPRRTLVTYWADLGRALIYSWRVLFATRERSLAKRLWLASATLSFWRGFARWQSFFKENGIKLHAQVGDSDVLLVARIAALESNGGVDMSFQFSGTGWMLPTNSRPVHQHQFFSWGRINAKMILRCDQESPKKAPNVFFIGGHMHHYFADLPAPAVKQQAEELRALGVNFIIAGIDSAMGDDVAPTPRHTEQFYRGLVAIAQEFSDVGILVKAHNAGHLTGAILAMINMPETGGRIRCLPPMLRPFQVFPHVDFVVSHGANNSSALEAGIAEMPHVYYDVFHWNEPVLRRMAPAELFVASEAALLETIRRQIAGGNPVYGSEAWRQYIHGIDPFRDRRAHERFARLLALLLEAIDRHGGDAASGMPEVVKRYGDEFGRERGVWVIQWPYATKTPVSPH
jgi:hypothetical protein